MKYRLAEHVSLTEVDDGAILLNVALGHYYGLNHIGVHFLRLIQNNKTEHQAITEIAKHYQIKTDEVESDIKELITSLIEQKLINAEE